MTRDVAEDFVTVPYRKKRVRKVPKKANHKHMREDCVLEITDPKWYERITIGSYCPRCGKILRSQPILGGPYYIDKRPEGSKFIIPDWTELARKEFDPATRTLPAFKVKDIFQKYIDDKP